MISKVFRYWLYIIRRSWSEVWKLLDMKGRIINLLVVTVFAILITISNNQITWNKEARDELIILFWVFVLIMPVLTFFNLFIVPAKIHDELGGFDNLKIRLVVECEPPRFSEAWASLRIYNDHSIKPITGCYAYLKSATSEKDGTSPLKRAGERLAWSSHNPPLHGEKDIPPNENRLIDIISTLHSENRIMFTTQGINDLYKDKAYSGNYFVTVGIEGIFSGKRFEEEVRVKIVYSGDMDLTCEEINSIVPNHSL